MTTPLIPLKSTLASTKYTPAELIADKATENWLLQTNVVDGLVLIRNIMNYYRDGATSYTHVFNSHADALYAVTTFTAYGYDVSGPGNSPDSTVIISWA